MILLYSRELSDGPLKDLESLKFSFSIFKFDKYGVRRFVHFPYLSLIGEKFFSL
jgi:hypothetical protein